jgi:hypothetical protein
LPIIVHGRIDGKAIKEWGVQGESEPAGTGTQAMSKNDNLAGEFLFICEKKGYNEKDVPFPFTPGS